MKWDVTTEDRDMLIEIYGLDSDQIFRAEKMYYSSSRSLLACGKQIKETDSKESVK